LEDWYSQQGYPKDVTLVSGACRTGADRMAEKAASLIGFTVEHHPADWNRHGRGAGFIRNNEMIKLGADVCFAFILNSSSGSTHTAKYAEKAGIPTFKFEKVK